MLEVRKKVFGYNDICDFGNDYRTSEKIYTIYYVDIKVVT